MNVVAWKENFTYGRDRIHSQEESGELQREGRRPQPLNQAGSEGPESIDFQVYLLYVISPMQVPSCFESQNPILAQLQLKMSDM